MAIAIRAIFIACSTGNGGKQGDEA